MYESHCPQLAYGKQSKHLTAAYSDLHVTVMLSYQTATCCLTLDVRNTRDPGTNGLEKSVKQLLSCALDHMCSIWHT